MSDYDPIPVSVRAAVAALKTAARNESLIVDLVCLRTDEELREGTDHTLADGEVRRMWPPAGGGDARIMLCGRTPAKEEA
jgi:hypothetical protein